MGWRYEWAALFCKRVGLWEWTLCMHRFEESCFCKLILCSNRKRKNSLPTWSLTHIYCHTWSDKTKYNTLTCKTLCTSSHWWTTVVAAWFFGNVFQGRWRLQLHFKPILRINKVVPRHVMCCWSFCSSKYTREGSEVVLHFSGLRVVFMYRGQKQN